jgi:hypothetical protein
VAAGQSRFAQDDVKILFEGEAVDSDSLSKTDDADETRAIVALKTSFRGQYSRIVTLRRQACLSAIDICSKEWSHREMVRSEVECVVLGIFARFDPVLQDLKAAFSKSVIAIKRGSSTKARSRRALDKRVTETLNKWFFEHINDPVCRFFYTVTSVGLHANHSLCSIRAKRRSWICPGLAS